MIPGNKVDKVLYARGARHRAEIVTQCLQEYSRAVSEEEGRQFANRMGTLFVEASAKTNVGVDAAGLQAAKSAATANADTITHLFFIGHSFWIV